LTDNIKKTVLIIDDEEDLRDIVSYQFKAKGFKVVTAFDGLDGLEQLKKVTPDLIILDMNMPRMNGLEFYEKIKGHDEEPLYPVLILTARANMEQLFRDLDVDGFIPKPFELNELVKEGAAIIRRRSSFIQKEKGTDEVRARRVCVVENDPGMFQKLTGAFLEEGYIVNYAHSGASALKRIPMDIPDVVVIKLALNDISGEVAVLKLKRLEVMKDVKFVLYTAKSAIIAEVTKKISHKEGFDKFIECTDFHEILEAVDGVFK